MEAVKKLYKSGRESVGKHDRMPAELGFYLEKAKPWNLCLLGTLHASAIHSVEPTGVV